MLLTQKDYKTIRNNLDNILKILDKNGERRYSQETQAILGAFNNLGMALQDEVSLSILLDGLQTGGKNIAYIRNQYYGPDRESMKLKVKQKINDEAGRGKT